MKNYPLNVKLCNVTTGVSSERRHTDIKRDRSAENTQGPPSGMTALFSIYPCESCGARLHTAVPSRSVATLAVTAADHF
jgi:hypothetical protein